MNQSGGWACGDIYGIRELILILVMVMLRKFQQQYCMAHKFLNDTVSPAEIQ
jgi:cell shape-determining protein MreD